MFVASGYEEGAVFHKPSNPPYMLAVVSLPPPFMYMCACSCVSVCVLLGIEPRALHMLGGHSLSHVPSLSTL